MFFCEIFNPVSTSEIMLQQIDVVSAWVTRLSPQAAIRLKPPPLRLSVGGHGWGLFFRSDLKANPIYFREPDPGKKNSYLPNLCFCRIMSAELMPLYPGYVFWGVKKSGWSPHTLRTSITITHPPTGMHTPRNTQHSTSTEITPGAGAIPPTPRLPLRSSKSSSTASSTLSRTRTLRSVQRPDDFLWVCWGIAPKTQPAVQMNT